MDETSKEDGECIPLQSFVGGLRTGLWNATWPLVRLDLYRDKVRLHSSTRVLNAIVPRWEARFDEITEVRAIGNIDGFNTGIRFRTSRPADFVLFWTLRRPEVLAALEAAGMTVLKEPTRFHHLNPNHD